jgi:hypothetical protein
MSKHSPSKGKEWDFFLWYKNKNKLNKTCNEDSIGFTGNLKTNGLPWKYAVSIIIMEFKYEDHFSEENASQL